MAPFLIRGVTTFELIANAESVVLRWWLKKQFHEARFPPDTQITFKKGEITADKDVLKPAE